MKLQGKTGLVTGATKGIGRAIARILAAEGVRLVLPWHDDWPEEAASLREEFGGAEQDHILVQADLRNRDEVLNMAAAIRRKTGTLEILVNNIERGGMPIVHGSYDRTVNSEQWRLELETTLLAKRLVFESCLPLLKTAEQAAVVNISSIAALTGRSGPAGLLFSDGYAAANRGIATLTETWARLGAPSIRVNELMLGIIDSRHGKNTMGWKSLPGEARKNIVSRTLLGRTGTPEDVAETVLFLVGRADYMTGAVVRLDGGFVLGGAPVPPMPEGTI